MAGVRGPGRGRCLLRGAMPSWQPNPPDEVEGNADRSSSEEVNDVLRGVTADDVTEQRDREADDSEYSPAYSQRSPPTDVPGLRPPRCIRRCRGRRWPWLAWRRRTVCVTAYASTPTVMGPPIATQTGQRSSRASAGSLLLQSHQPARNLMSGTSARREPALAGFAEPATRACWQVTFG
jgi:hypothetical protein